MAKKQYLPKNYLIPLRGNASGELEPSELGKIAKAVKGKKGWSLPPIWPMCLILAIIFVYALIRFGG